MRLFERKGIKGAVTFKDGKGNTKIIVFTRKKVLEYDPDFEAWRVISATVAKEIMS